MEAALSASTPYNPYTHHRFPVEIISHGELHYLGFAVDQDLQRPHTRLRSYRPGDKLIMLRDIKR